MVVKFFEGSSRSVGPDEYELAASRSTPQRFGPSTHERGREAGCCSRANFWDAAVPACSSTHLRLPELLYVGHASTMTASAHRSVARLADAAHRYVYYVERPNNERLAASNPELYALLNPAKPPPGVVSVHEASGRQLMADGSIRRPDR